MNINIIVKASDSVFFFHTIVTTHQVEHLVPIVFVFAFVFVQKGKNIDSPGEGRNVVGGVEHLGPLGEQVLQRCAVVLCLSETTIINGTYAKRMG